MRHAVEQRAQIRCLGFYQPELSDVVFKIVQYILAMLAFGLTDKIFDDRTQVMAMSFKRLSIDSSDIYQLIGPRTVTSPPVMYSQQ